MPKSSRSSSRRRSRAAESAPPETATPTRSPARNRLCLRTYCRTDWPSRCTGTSYTPGIAKAGGESRLSRWSGAPGCVKQNHDKAGDKEQEDLREGKSHEMQHQAVERNGFAEGVGNQVPGATACECVRIFRLGR